jgi:hypothetical protein
LPRHFHDDVSGVVIRGVLAVTMRDTVPIAGAGWTGAAVAIGSHPVITASRLWIVPLVVMIPFAMRAPHVEVGTVAAPE